MDFAIGDELVYNPSHPDLMPATKRPGDWGRIVKISNEYINFRFNNGHNSIIKQDAFTHSPNSPKYLRALYKNVLVELPAGYIKKEVQRYKNMYQVALRDVVYIALTKDYEGFNAF